LIGFAIMMSVIDEAHLLNIGISPRYQGRGYGARMLRHIMSVAKSHGAGKLFLEVRPSNEQAVSLYRHFGFRQIGLRRGYYPAAIGREDGLVFDKDLA
jgi:ribosomal-protein-alanine N-acetyltransferase